MKNLKFNKNVRVHFSDEWSSKTVTYVVEDNSQVYGTVYCHDYETVSIYEIRIGLDGSKEQTVMACFAPNVCAGFEFDLVYTAATKAQLEPSVNRKEVD